MFLVKNGALRSHSPKTTASYRNRLQTFIVFLGNPEIDVATALVSDNAVHYFYWLEQRGYKPTTIEAKKQALSAFWAWAYQQGLTKQKLEIRVKKADKPPVVYLTSEEAARIEHAALGGTSSRGFLHLRDQAAFTLLHETEIPLRALAGLTIDAYNPVTRTLIVGTMTVLLSDHLCETLDRYLQARRIQEL
ncbi:MAG: site-specific integrase [Anaerolineae bacterium]|nr:site-specific integrase [Anaerolineae bacterium]